MLEIIGGVIDKRGLTGNGIESIENTATVTTDEKVTKTYTITLTNGDTCDFDVVSINEDYAESVIEDAEAAQRASESARDVSISSKNDAVSAKNDAVSAKNDAVSANNDAQTARTGSESARDTAISAKNDAVSAKTNAETAQGLAEDARDEAKGYAEDIEELTVSATTLSEGSEASVTKTGGGTTPYNLEFGIPKGDTGDTYTITEADYEEIANIVESQYTVELANLEEDIDSLDLTKANIDGYYDTLSVGLADNLIDRKGNGTPQEISYRTSCGDDSIADDGNGIIQSIYGKTVVWNRLVNYTVIPASYTMNGITFVNNFDGTFTCNGTATADAYLVVSTVVSTRGGHKAFISGCPSGGSRQTYHVAEAWNGTTDTGNGVIGNIYAQGNYDIRIIIKNGVTVNNLVFAPCLHDLTVMFGAGNEPTSVDDPRIKWIKQYATAHPEYNSGELISYNGSGIKTVGFNLFDEDSTEISGNYRRYKLPIGKTNQLYMSFKDKDTSINVSDLYVGFMQGEELTPDNPVAWCMSSGVIGSNHSNITNGGVYCDNLLVYPKTDEAYARLLQRYDICVNIQWSGYRNGEYEPYWSRTLALPISTYFPDGMKSAGSVRDEMTKDKAVKRIGKVDLGTLNLASNSGTYPTTQFFSIVKITDGKADTHNLITPDLNRNVTSYINSSGTLIISLNTSYASHAEVREAMQGKYLYYELAEPIETTITPPLDLTYKVADFGTEESIAEGKSTPFNGIIKYSDDFTRGLVNMPKNYDTTASLDALATSLSTMLTSALDGTVTITRGAYDSTNKKYAWNCSFTPNA